MMINIIVLFFVFNCCTRTWSLKLEQSACNHVLTVAKLKDKMGLTIKHLCFIELFKMKGRKLMRYKLIAPRNSLNFAVCF